MFNAAIVGCGRIASTFDDDPKRKSSIATHAGAYDFFPETKLIAAADIDSAKLKEFGKKWGVAKLYTDYQDMLAKEKIDILSVCTWNPTHFQICRKAISCGVKAIFCEKPITEKLSDADRLVELCEENGVILAVNHSRRWDKMHQQIKDFVEQGNLGKIQGVSGYYTAGILNTGIHMIDLLRFFFGDVAWVSGCFDGKASVADPSADACLYFKQGFLVTLQGFDVTNYLIFEIDIYGAKGRLRIENSGFEASFYSMIGHPKFSGYKCLGERQKMFNGGLQDTLINAIDDLVFCLKKGNKPKSSAEDGRAALEIISAIYESGRDKNGAKVLLPLKKQDV